MGAVVRGEGDDGVFQQAVLPEPVDYPAERVIQICRIPIVKPAHGANLFAAQSAAAGIAVGQAPQPARTCPLSFLDARGKDDAAFVY